MFPPPLLPTSRPVRVDLVECGGAVLKGEIVALRHLYICIYTGEYV